MTKIEQWCKDHPQCKGCKFVGAECVAPASDGKFKEWIGKMANLIEKEVASR